MKQGFVIFSKQSYSSENTKRSWNDITHHNLVLFYSLATDTNTNGSNNEKKASTSSYFVCLVFVPDIF